MVKRDVSPPHSAVSDLYVSQNMAEQYNSNYFTVVVQVIQM